MENFMFWVLALLAAITAYRLLSRRAVSPKARVAAMLRRYRALEGTGLSEQECLLCSCWRHAGIGSGSRMVFSSSSSRDFSPRKMSCVSSRFGGLRLSSRSLSRDRHEGRPGFGHGGSCMFVRSIRLSAANRRTFERSRVCAKTGDPPIQPNQYFTNLPLAATYHETGRH